MKVACSDLEIDLRTFHSWKKNPKDKRKGPLTTPKNKLSNKERKEIINTATSKEYLDLSPWIIVAKLADEGRYIASESSFYKVLKERKLLEHRGKSKSPTKEKPAPLIATAPNQIWSWDITYLKSNIRAQIPEQLPHIEATGP